MSSSRGIQISNWSKDKIEISKLLLRVIEFALVASN